MSGDYSRITFDPWQDYLGVSCSRAASSRRRLERVGGRARTAAPRRHARHLIRPRRAARWCRRDAGRLRDPRPARRRSRSAAAASTSTACWPRTTARRRSRGIRGSPSSPVRDAVALRAAVPAIHAANQPAPAMSSTARCSRRAAPRLPRRLAARGHAPAGPDLIEKAVGVDTTTRLQTVWQVKCCPNTGDATCATPTTTSPAGRRDAAVGAPADHRDRRRARRPDPCLVPPGGGYKGLENQLYRVEIHAAARGHRRRSSGRATTPPSRRA